MEAAKDKRIRLKPADEAALATIAPPFAETMTARLRWAIYTLKDAIDSGAIRPANNGKGPHSQPDDFAAAS